MNKENFLLKVYINLLLFLLVPLYSFSTIYNGGYGDYNSIKWNLDTETGILTISGTGDMPLSSGGSAPYYSHVNYIKSIIVENGITSICNGAFYNCTNLLSVSLPNTITSIGENAFSNCNKLPEIAIPNSVNIIKRAAFSQCRALTSITIPESVTEIGTALFAYCTNLEHIIVDNNNKIYDSRDNCNAIIETATNELVASCKNTTIPSTVTSIGYSAFASCTSQEFTSIVIPEGVQIIKSGAFDWCLYLKEIILPSSLKDIGETAFRDCQSLEKIVLPENLENIGSLAFGNCHNLKKVVSHNPVPPTIKDNSFFYSYIDTLYVPYNAKSKYTNAQYWKNFKNIVELPPYDFESNGFYYNIISKEDQTCEVTYFDGSANNHYNNYKAYYGTVSIPSTTKYNDKTYDIIRIGDNAFNNCYNLDSIYIPNNIKSIGAYAFYNCYKLKNVKIPNSVTAISYAAFNRCSALNSVDLPKEIYEIGFETFANCTNLTSITIPQNVTRIANYAFSNCKNLSSIISLNSTPPEISKYVFWDNNSNEDCYGATLFVPYKTKSVYATKEHWNNFNNIVEIVNTYKVEYSINNEIIYVDSVKEGSLIPTYIPQKDGYTFNGWENLPDIMPSNNIVVEGSYTVNEYLLSYIIDGSLYKIIRVNCDEKIENLQLEDREGYSFIWENWIDKMPAKDYSLRGKYIPNYYAITYIVDGNIFATDSIVYGDNIPLIDTPIKEGYTFSGWDSIPITMPAADVIVSGTFAVNSYKVTYTIDGEIFATDSIVYGDSIPLIDNPVKEGYTFYGWSDAPTTMPAADVTINGSFEVNTYAVTYIVDGDTVAVDSVAYGAEITPIAAPVKEGYTFSGWSETAATMPAEDVTINGTYAVNYYNVTYVVDGKIFATDSIAYGSGIKLIAAPEKEGYTFSGWSDAPATMPAEDVTISGAFAVNYYKVTYIVDKEIFATDSVAYGSEIKLIAAPEKEGYTFCGWGDAPATMPAEDVTISGAFAVNYYKVTYIVDKEIFATDSVAYGSGIKLIAAPEKEGYTFYGWSDAPTTMPAEDVTINGSFAVNKYAVAYVVDGDTVATDSIAYGAEITPIAAPEKEGHTFSGWSKTPATMPANDIIIRGSFEINTYVVTYIVDGVTYATDSIVFNGDVNVISAPEKEGHTFSGWSYAPKKMPAENITISGSFSVNYYTITYIVDGVAYDSLAVAYGSEITFISAPEKEGHTFSGWSEAPATMPANDIVINGSFSVNYYTLTYIVDGEEYKTEQVAYGDSVVLIDAPVKENYIFSGWSDAPAIVPAEDIIITGSFVHTSINSVSAEATVKVNGNSIALVGVENCCVAVYSTNGALVEKFDAYAGEEITLDKGVYIVRVGNKTMKVKL